VTTQRIVSIKKLEQDSFLFLSAIGKWDFNWKLSTVSIFTPAIENKTLHENSNDNSVRVANFATSKHSVVKNRMFLYLSIHHYT
jgi:hypothetical protein